MRSAALCAAASRKEALPDRPFLAKWGVWSFPPPRTGGRGGGTRVPAVPAAAASRRRCQCPVEGRGGPAGGSGAAAAAAAVPCAAGAGRREGGGCSRDGAALLAGPGRRSRGDREETASFGGRAARPRLRTHPPNQREEDVRPRWKARAAGEGGGRRGQSSPAALARKALLVLGVWLIAVVSETAPQPGRLLQTATVGSCRSVSAGVTTHNTPQRRARSAGGRAGPWTRRVLRGYNGAMW